MNSNGTRQGLGMPTLDTLGIVYGDIGTSPLHTMKEVFNPAHGVPLDAPNIVGAVSVIFWAPMVAVTLKYVILILRADNRSGGGRRRWPLRARQRAARAPAADCRARRGAVLQRQRHHTGYLGAGAVEGLESITPAFKPFVVPISVAIIVVLFMVQRFGTGAVGKFFGPITTVWFEVLGVMGRCSW